MPHERDDREVQVTSRMGYKLELSVLGQPLSGYAWWAVVNLSGQLLGSHGGLQVLWAGSMFEVNHFESLPDSKVSLIYGQMNEPPGARMRVGLSALTVAEFFREDLQQDGVTGTDNVFNPIGSTTVG